MRIKIAPKKKFTDRFFTEFNDKSNIDQEQNIDIEYSEDPKHFTEDTK